MFHGHREREVTREGQGRGHQKGEGILFIAESLGQQEKQEDPG